MWIGMFGRSSREPAQKVVSGVSDGGRRAPSSVPIPPAPQNNAQRLAHVGPRDPDNGYPLWFEDAAGTRLALGLSRGEDPNLVPIDGTLPGPLVIPGNFPDEAFYFAAEAELNVGGTGVAGRARLILALEAAFGGAGDPDPNARVVFARIRVRMDDLIPDATYVVVHPYGVTDELAADEDGRVFWTEDLGVANEDFTAVLRDGRVAPFLRWTRNGERAPGEANPPPGYLGDGITAHTVIDSPFGTNVFRVIGPQVAVLPGQPVPADPDVVETNLFTVQGKIAQIRGVAVDRAVYHRQGAQTLLDVFATSAPGEIVELGGAGVPRARFTTLGRAYMARVAATAGAPATVDVLNVSDQPATRVTAPVTDQVSVTRAEFDIAAGSLTVVATSSDDQQPALTVQGIGGAGPTPIGPISGSPFAMAAAPAAVLVSSAAGGSTTFPVTMTGASLPPIIGATAVAGADTQVDTGAMVTLDGTGSRGASSFAWSINAPAVGTLSGETTPTPTYTAPAAVGADTVTLSVQGTAGGPSTDTVTVTVVPPPPPTQVSITRAEFRTGRQQLRVEGQVSGGRLPIDVTVTLGGVVVGTAPADGTRDWALRSTLSASTPVPIPAVGDVSTATATGGAAATREIRIRN